MVAVVMFATACGSGSDGVVGADGRVDLPDVAHDRRDLAAVPSEGAVIVVDSVGEGTGSTLVVSSVSAEGVSSRRVLLDEALVDLSTWVTPAGVRVVGVPCPESMLASDDVAADPDEREVCRSGHRVFDVREAAERAVDLGPLGDAEDTTKLEAADADGRALLVPTFGSPQLVTPDGEVIELQEAARTPGTDVEQSMVSAAFCNHGGEPVAVVATSTGSVVGSSDEPDRGSTTFHFYDPDDGTARGTSEGAFTLTDLACSSTETVASSTFGTHTLDLNASPAVLAEAPVGGTAFASAETIVWLDRSISGDLTVQNSDGTQGWHLASADSPVSLVSSGDVLVAMWPAGGPQTYLEYAIADV